MLFILFALNIKNMPERTCPWNNNENTEENLQLNMKIDLHLGGRRLLEAKERPSALTDSVLVHQQAKYTRSLVSLRRLLSLQPKKSAKLGQSKTSYYSICIWELVITVKRPFPPELLHYGLSRFNKSKIIFLPFAYYSTAEHRRLKRERGRESRACSCS